MRWANDLEGLLDAAEWALLRQDPKAAEGILRPAVLEGATTLSAVWAGLGLVARMTDENDKAEAELSRALGVWDAAHAAGDPSPVGPLQVLPVVSMLVDAKRTDEAVSVARAAAGGPEDPRLAIALGIALSAEDDYTGAAQAWVRASTGLLATGSVDMAIFYANLASSLPEAGPDVALAAARALAAKGDTSSARTRYEEAVASDSVARSPALEAELARIEGNAADALARADAVLAAAPDDVEALAVRAQSLRDLGRFPEAIATFGQVLKDGGGDRFRIMRGALRYFTGDSDGALADLETVGPLASKAPVLSLIRAEIYLSKERYEDAVHWFDLYLSLDPGHAIARGERALALFGRGERAEAEEEVEALLAQPPADQAVADWMSRQGPTQAERLRGELLLVRGRLYMASERYSQARADIIAASDVIESRPDLTVALARAILLAGDPAGALATVEAAPLTATVPDVLWVKASALAQLGRYDDALGAISEALAINSGNVNYRRIRSSVLLALGSFEEAVADLLKLSESLPEDAEVQHMLGVAFRQIGRGDEALGRLAAAETMGGGADVFIDHASLLSDLDRPDEALEVLAGAAKRFPQNASVFEAQGSLLASKGDFAKAVEALRRSLELDPDEPRVAGYLGEYLRRLGDYDQALTWLDRALDAEPDSFYALGTKGQVLRARGDRASGLALLKQAVKLARDDAPGWLVEELATALTDENTPTAWAEALAHLDRFLAKGTVEAWALAAKADTLRLLGRAAEGLQAADQALEAASNEGKSQDEGTLATKAHLLADLSRSEEAMVLADQLLAAAATEQRDNSFARSARVRALLALDRYAEALVELDRYLKAVPGDTWGLLTKADILTDYREFSGALAILEDVGPGVPARDGLIGYCRNRLGDPRSAISALNAAVAADNQAWWSWVELGFAHWDVREADAALRAFQVLVTEATSSSGTDLDLLANAAYAAYHLHDPTGAVGFAQRALAAAPMNPAIRLELGVMLLLIGRGLAALDEVEAAVATAAQLPDPLRGAAILEEAIYDFDRLDREGALDQQREEADEALDLLHTTVKHLRHHTAAT